MGSPGVRDLLDLGALTNEVLAVAEQTVQPVSVHVVAGSESIVDDGGCLDLDQEIRGGYVVSLHSYIRGDQIHDDTPIQEAPKAFLDPDALPVAPFVLHTRFTADAGYALSSPALVRST